MNSSILTEDLLGFCGASIARILDKETDWPKTIDSNAVVIAMAGLNGFQIPSFFKGQEASVLAAFEEFRKPERRALFDACNGDFKVAITGLIFKVVEDINHVLRMNEMPAFVKVHALAMEYIESGESLMLLGPAEAIGYLEQLKDRVGK